MPKIGHFTFRSMDITSARQIAIWQYPPPCELYSYDPADVAENAQEMLTPHYHYYTVWDEQGELIGYRCVSSC